MMYFLNNILYFSKFPTYSYETTLSVPKGSLEGRFHKRISHDMIQPHGACAVYKVKKWEFQRSSLWLCLTFISIIWCVLCKFIFILCPHCLCV